MSDHRPGVLQYKCRRCGAVAANAHVPDVMLALIAIELDGRTPRAWGMVMGMTDVHSCGAGAFGIADLIGVGPDARADAGESMSDRPARIPFDVNGTVAVRLNDRGRAIYRLYYPRLESPRVDAAGRSRFQLHQLMAIFGPYVGVGFDPPFDAAIELEPAG